MRHTPQTHFGSGAFLDPKKPERGHHVLALGQLRTTRRDLESPRGPGGS